MDLRLMNYPLMLLWQSLVGAAAGAIRNAIQQDDIAKSAKGGVITGIVTATVSYLSYICFGFTLGR